jgi:hypothetical protein
MVRTGRRSTRFTEVTPATFMRLFGVLIAGAIASGTLVANAVAAPVDPQPSGGATCTDNTDCTVHAGRPGQHPQPRPSGGHTGTGSTEPPIVACHDVVVCPPPTPAPPGRAVTPARLATDAFAKLPIRGPQIGIEPHDGPGLVGLPVWLWTDVNALTWGPYTATAAVPGLTVTAVARATSITWNMGDGRQVVCRNPGTPYNASYGNTASPTCGYRYAHSSRSQADGAYRITGTTTWVIAWTGGGTAGVINQTRQTQLPALHIDELQVVTK